MRGNRVEEAIARLEGAGGLSAQTPERSFLLIDLWTGRCGTARARAAADALPDHPLAELLRSHARRDPEDRRRRIQRARTANVQGWAYLESAFVSSEEGGSPKSVHADAMEAAERGPAFVRREAYLLAARALVDDRRGREALALALRAMEVDPADPRGPGLASQIAGRLGLRSDAALLAWQSLRLAPGGSRAARRVADIVRDGVEPGVEARLRAEMSAVLGTPGASAETEALAGLLAERAGDRETARARYASALGRGADPVPVDRHLRRLLLVAGRRKEGLAYLRRSVPPDVVTDPRNVRREAWVTLDRAAARVPDGPASAVPADALGDLAEALVGVGAVEDALALLPADGPPRLRALATRLGAEVRFERAFRELVEEGYRAPASGNDPPTLDELLARLRALAREHLPVDEQAAFEGTQGRRTVPFLGTWLDHGTDTSSPLVARFRKVGKYLMLGQRTGSPPEVILLSIASLTRAQEIPTQGLSLSHDVAVGYDREIRALIDFQGGSLSGAALPDGVWLDADAARREDHQVRAILRAEPAFLARIEAAGREPPVPDDDAGPYAMDDTNGLASRLALRYARRVGDDRWGSFHALRAHEFGHVLDLDRHLPILDKLPSTAGLLASEGFAAARVEARLEGRAQLASLRDGRDPDLALIDLVRSLPLVERSPEAHERGYRAVVEAMVRWTYANAWRFPAIDPTRKILPQLDRLTPEEIRAMGNGVAAQGWTVR